MTRATAPDGLPIFVLTPAAHRIINGTKRYHMDRIKQEARNAAAKAG